MATIADVVAWADGRYPPHLAEDWDRPGLSVGDPHREVHHVRFAVDPTIAVVNEAIGAGADMLITHHPLMLRGVTTVAANTSQGAVVHALIEGGCALFAAHTNADAVEGGVAEALAIAIGMHVEGPLIPAQPGSVDGTGRIGTVAPTSLSDFAASVADALPATAGGVLYAGDPDGMVLSVAVVGGSGGSFIGDAVSAGVDVFVTADMRHHPATDAREAAMLNGGRPYLVSVSHAASESLWLDGAAAELSQALGVATSVSTLNTDPWTGHAPSTT